MEVAVGRVDKEWVRIYVPNTRPSALNASLGYDGGRTPPLAYLLWRVIPKNAIGHRRSADIISHPVAVPAHVFRNVVHANCWRRNGITSTVNPTPEVNGPVNGYCVILDHGAGVRP
jgi:hypothetical protein